jgi:phage FluMu gp28-like protein
MRIGTPSPTILAKYRSSLPSREFAALDAWLSQFYNFQLGWMLDQSDQAFCNKSRQIGLSHTTSGTGVIWGAFHGELTTIISVGEEESKEVLDKAKRHAKVLCGLGSEMAVPVRDNATEIVFASGGRVRALPSTGGRGFSGNVFLDEYAYQPNPTKVWDAAAAVTMLGYKLRVVSTPNGVGDEFHNISKLARAEESQWAYHEIPIEQAMADGYPVDLARCWTLAKGDPRLFDQLFRCKFLDSSLQYIPSGMINDASQDRDIPPTGFCYAGLDIGKKNDLTVLIVVKKVGEQCFVVHIETRKRTDSQGLAEMVSAAMNRYNVQRLAVDETGLGTFPAGAMQKYYGAHRVEPVNFTNKSKEALATGMYAAFANTGIILPKTEREGCSSEDVVKIREDIASIRRIITEAGNVRYDAPHTDEGHADRAWALALALHAAGSGYAPPDWDFLDAVGKQWPKPLEL